MEIIRGPRGGSVSIHFRDECSCGALIGQCRCPSIDPLVRVIRNGCRDCVAREVLQELFDISRENAR